MNRNGKWSRRSPVRRHAPDTELLELNVSQAAMSSLGDDAEGDPFGPNLDQWHFGAYLATGEVVFRQTIVAHEDLCAAFFVDALVAHLAKRGVTVTEVVVAVSPVFASAAFNDACAKLRIALQRPS